MLKELIPFGQELLNSLKDYSDKKENTIELTKGKDGVYKWKG